MPSTLLDQLAEQIRAVCLDGFCLDEQTWQYLQTTLADPTPESVKKIVIPNGVNMDLWSFADRSIVERKTISVVGILTEKKGPQLLGQVIKYFAKHRPDYKFQLRLDIIEKPCMSERTLRHIIRDCDNWEWVPRQESLNRFLEDSKYLISTSTLESFSYVIAEAMAKGIKPLIYDWLGARELWPENLIWSDIDELCALIDSEEYASKEYRQYVESHYGLDKLVVSVKTEIDNLLLPEVAE